MATRRGPNTCGFRISTPSTEGLEAIMVVVGFAPLGIPRPTMEAVASICRDPHSAAAPKIRAARATRLLEAAAVVLQADKG